MEAIELQRQFYNSRWQQLGFANRLKLARCIAILEGINATGLKEPRMLDLGCGSGWLAGIVGLFGPTLGVDLSDEAVKAASVKFPHVQFMQADILNWEYPKNLYDILISQEVIEHVEDQEKYLDIANSLLRPGGYLLLTTPNASTFHAMPEEQSLGWSRQPIENWLTVGQLKRLLEQRFEMVRLTTIIPGYGIKGSYRFINSSRLRTALKTIGCARLFDEVRLRQGYGLHSFAIARKPSEHVTR